MENQKSTVNASIMYGLLLSIVLIVFSLLMYLLDVDHDSKIMWLSYLIMAGGLFWAMVSYRDKYSGGFLSYGSAFGVGFWTGLFASVLASAFTYFFVTMINPGMIEQILIETENNMLESNPNISDEELDMILSYTEKFTTPVMLTVIGFIANVFFATILSLIIAIFVKREATIEIVEEEVTEE